LIRDFRAALLPGTAHLRLEVFCQEWNGALLQAGPTECRVFVPLAGTFWQRLCGKTVGVDIRVQIEGPARKNGTTRLTVTMLPVRCHAALLKQFQENIGPTLLTSLQSALCAAPERRQSERIPMAAPITVRHRKSGHRPTEVACHGKDVSALGICFMSPTAMESREIRIQFNLPGQAEAAPVVLRGKIARCEPQPDGLFEVGAQFLIDNSAK
jgi:hypothetical protein